MLLRRFYDENLAHASYLIGCERSGEALVVDPSRNIDQYLELAQAKGLRLSQVTETHIHADFVSGARELAAATGASLYLSDEGVGYWKYDFADENTVLLHDGDSWMLGNIRIDVLHTPGHTPEHLSFVVTDSTNADEPLAILTGDFVFVGDVGRPDLLEEAAGEANTKVPGAQDLFRSLQRLRQYPDFVQILPAHGAGSACGKSLGAVPTSTLGYEKRFNPAFQFQAEGPFVEWLLSDQPEVPRYFAQMKRVNKQGPELLAEKAAMAKLDRPALDKLLANGELVIDLRDRDAYAAAHVPGTVSIPMSSTKFSTYIGWFVDYDKPLYILLPAQEKLHEVEQALLSIGVDQVPGYFLPEVVRAGAHSSLPRLSIDEMEHLLATEGATILDVRGNTEYEEQHISMAQHIPLGYLPQRLDELPQDRPLLIHCQSGYRSQVAATVLRRLGMENALPIDASFEDIANVLAPTP